MYSEGHLLDHPYVSDVCVVGVPDEYSGELPFAFIMASVEAAALIEKGESAKVKDAIAKVCNRLNPFFLIKINLGHAACF